MPTPPPYSADGATDVGKIRRKNDDAFLVDTQSHTFAVADGLGGLPAGDVASKTAIQNIKQALSTQSPDATPDFQALFELVQKNLNKTGRVIGGDFGIATTLTVAHLQNNTLHIGHVGDSGLLLIPHNQPMQKVTADHTMAEDIIQELDPDESIKSIPEFYRNALTQCIGYNESLSVQQLSISPNPKDILILYTDGITKELSLSEIESIARSAPSPKALTQSLLGQANLRGGRDNSTAVVLFF